MNSKNKVLIGCLALLLVLSVGYALFSDTITINGTASAKGEFSLTTTCDDIAPTNSEQNAGLVSDAKIICKDNIINASATLGYPGSIKWFRVKVENTGTIPAKINKIVELNAPENMIFQKDNGFVDLPYFENCDGDKTNRVCSVFHLGDGIYSDFESGSEGVEPDWYQLEAIDPTLEPGETAYFYVEMQWLSTSTTPGEPLVASLDVEIDWQQVTE